jgi:hypothetical protein
MSLAKRIFTAADLVPGQTYRVVLPFKDYDQINHPVGESWRFLEKHFLPYEDGLTLVILLDGQKMGVRLQWRGESQADIIDHFSDYVETI